jgi:hypothetical protein
MNYGLRTIAPKVKKIFSLLQTLQNSNFCKIIVLHLGFLFCLPIYESKTKKLHGLHLHLTSLKLDHIHHRVLRNIIVPLTVQGDNNAHAMFVLLIRVGTCMFSYGKFKVRVRVVS